MYIYERMTSNVFYIELNCSVSKAFQVMTETKHSHLPVVDKDKKLVGLITEELLSDVNTSSTASLNIFLSQTKVKDIMRTGIFNINKDQLVEKAAFIMKENHISCLPVVDNDNILVGIITRIDIFKAFIEITGMKDIGTRIILKLKDNQHNKAISDIFDIISKYNINIIHSSKYKNKTHFELNLKLDTYNTEEISLITEEFKNNGYEILGILKED